MHEIWSDLPEECWALILTKLDRLTDLESLSLVSNTLLFITNRCRSTLRVINPSIQILTTSLKRFPFLNKVDFSYFRGDLDEALVKISESTLDLKELNISHSNKNLCSVSLKEIGRKMKNIKVFTSSDSYLSDTHIFILAEFFWSIEELDISRQHVQNITDQGIVALSMKHKSLRKIKLSGNAMISDQSLISLSANCAKLTEIAVGDCIHVSLIGISAILRNCPGFSSLIILASNIESDLIFTSPFIHFSKHLCKIELFSMKISNEILYEMVRANLPLKQFSLSYCINFTQDGLSFFLKAYQFLESLALDGINFITDNFVALISEFIGYLTFISLESCYELTVLSFGTIALVCPSLKTINMRLTPSSNEAMHDILNPSIKSCSFHCTTLDGLLQICPNLQILNVSCLAHPEELDIANILSSCRELRQLTISFNSKLKFDGGIPCNLETLCMKTSGVDDQVLEMVSKRCPELLKLDLEGGMDVTEKGLKMVMQNCKKLRYVNLEMCTKLKKDVVEWMVASCPSLREIVTPYPFEHNQIDFGNCLLKMGSSLPVAFYIWSSCY